MIDLKFSYNWNKKLDCRAFTTIRLYQPAKHYRGQSVRVLLKDNCIAEGMVHDVQAFYLTQMNTYMAWIDTGYSVEEAQAIIRKMYPKVDFSQQRLALLLIVKEETKKAVPQELFSQA